eukprot:scaffold1523_cov426-Prasinococcus_capsulatus_cf.AAC.1
MGSCAMQNIAVCVRVRPLNEKEAGRGTCWRVADNVISQTSGDQDVAGCSYTLDQVFDASRTTNEVYIERAKGLIEGAFAGFNGTIFAYGQTSSGKTHTMRGTVEEPGIIPRAVEDSFRIIHENQGREFLIRVSYLEIYNEDINDLLVPENRKLHIHETAERGIYVAGVAEKIVTTPQQVLQLMVQGDENRHVGETNMNARSSRSHSIFRMVIESRERGSTDAVRVSTLNLVDLAGSERVSKTGAEGARMKEGAHINRSLLTLGNVINKLTSDSASSHIPYRDSKLTRILQPALGGNSRTAIICAVTPSTLHADETNSTLRFACRAKKVTNHAKVNEVSSDDAALLKRQAKEIEMLRKKLKSQAGRGSGDLPDIDGEIAKLRNELLIQEEQSARMADLLEAEKAAREVQEKHTEEQQRKIESLTKLVMVSNNLESSAPRRQRKDPRRETWAPSAAAGQPLLAPLSPEAAPACAGGTPDNTSRASPGSPAPGHVAQ